MEQMFDQKPENMLSKMIVIALCVAISKEKRSQLLDAKRIRHSPAASPSRADTDDEAVEEEVTIPQVPCRFIMSHFIGLRSFNQFFLVCGNLDYQTFDLITYMSDNIVPGLEHLYMTLLLAVYFHLWQACY